MSFNFLKSLDADDIFISYSRTDAEAYVVGLDAALSALQFSCFFDKRGTDADRLPPETLFRKIKLCKTLVLVVSPGTLEDSTNITPEVEAFAVANGTSRIIPVSFDQGTNLENWSDEPWYPRVVGKSRERDKLEALMTGEPSPAIIKEIEKTSTYMKSKDRLLKYRNRALTGFLVLLGLGLIAFLVALYGMWQVRVTRIRAAAAEEAAQKKIEKAGADVVAARLQAEGDISKAKADANTEVTRIENETKTKIATTEKLARDAERKRAAATAEASRQQTIAQSRWLANRSQTLLRQRPDEGASSLSIAIDSMKTSSRIGVHTVEADAALRDNLAVIPRLLHDYSYPSSVPALSPKAQYYAGLADKKLRVYEAGQPKEFKEFSCDCTAIALSSKPLYAATVSKEGIEIFDLESGTRGHFVKPPPGIVAEKIALSPDGRYLAVVASQGNYGGDFSRMWVLTTVDSKVIKAFEDESKEVQADKPDIATAPSGRLNMVIYDIAFGPSGNLGVSGRSIHPKDGLSGRVILWSLTAAKEAVYELTSASFSNVEVITQRDQVGTIAPGTDLSYFATEKGVWRRGFGQTAYEIVAHDLAGSGTFASLAFAPDGRTLTKVGSEGKDGVGNTSYEVWDANGIADRARAYQKGKISDIAFKPGSEFVIANVDDYSNGGPLHVFRSDKGTEADTNQIEPFADDARVIFQSSYSGHLVTANEQNVFVWDVWRKEKVIVPFTSAFVSVRKAALSPDAMFLALAGSSVGNSDNAETIVVYRRNKNDFSQWKRLPAKYMIGGFDHPTEISISADGKVVAAHYRESIPAATDVNYIKIFDLANGRDITPKSVKEMDVPWLTMIDPSGKFLAVAHIGGQTELVNLRTGGIENLLDESRMGVPELQINHPMTNCIAFSSDGRYIALGSDHGVVEVFDTHNLGDAIARIQHAGEITALAFSDDDNYLATASSNLYENQAYGDESYPVRILWLQPRDLVAEAEHRLKDVIRLSQ